MTVRRVTQLELTNFAQTVEQADQEDLIGLLTPAEVLAQELAHKKALELEPDSEIPQWAEKYHELLEAGIRGRIAAYIAWATMPKQYRWPKTQEELANKVLGLTSDRAIATWRKKYPEIDLMIADLQAAEMLRYRPGAFHALGKVASEENYRANQDRKLFFEMSGDHTPRQKILGDDGRIGGKVAAQLRKLPTAKLIEMLGEDALEMVAELEEEAGDEFGGEELTTKGTKSTKEENEDKG